MPGKVAIAIGAHPDDIEFYMAGTLLMLKQKGYEIHYLNLASGNCGSVQYNAATTRSIRNTEARAAAKILGAQFHPSLTEDLEIIYNLEPAPRAGGRHPRSQAQDRADPFAAGLHGGPHEHLPAGGDGGVYAGDAEFQDACRPARRRITM